MAMAMVNNITNAMNAMHTCALCVFMCEKKRITVLCVLSLLVVLLLQHFRWSIASRRVYRSICRWMPPKKVDAPTNELTWPFLSKNVSVNALFRSTKLWNAHRDVRSSIWLAVQCALALSFTSRLATYFVAFFIRRRTIQRKQWPWALSVRTLHYPHFMLLGRCYAIKFVVWLNWPLFKRQNARNAIYAIREEFSPRETKRKWQAKSFDETNLNEEVLQPVSRVPSS